MSTTPTDLIYPTSKWVIPKDNNFQLDLEVFKGKEPIMPAILRHHHLWYAFSAAVPVPSVYLQQFWGTLQTKVAPDNSLYYEAKLAGQTVEVTRELIRHVLRLPSRPENEYEASEDELLEDIHRLGYFTPVKFLSQIQQSMLPHPWQTLFALVNKCFSPKHSGHDRCNITILRIFHGIAFNKNIDYAKLVMLDLDDQMMQRTKGKKTQYLPYPRWFGLMIHHFIQSLPEIPTRPADEYVTPPKLKYLQKGKVDEK